MQRAPNRCPQTRFLRPAPRSPSACRESQPPARGRTRSRSDGRTITAGCSAHSPASLTSVPPASRTVAAASARVSMVQPTLRGREAIPSRDVDGHSGARRGTRRSPIIARRGAARVRRPAFNTGDARTGIRPRTDASAARLDLPVGIISRAAVRRALRRPLRRLPRWLALASSRRAILAQQGTLYFHIDPREFALLQGAAR